MRVYWLEQTQADVAESNEWLTAEELIRFNTLRFSKRRADWRLGRWTAKCALFACFDVAPSIQDLSRIEIRALPSGAPLVVAENLEVPKSISLSHRAGRAMCAVSFDGPRLGCDLELIEARESTFVADYFTTEEQAFMVNVRQKDRDAITALIWSAKESALKATGEGLRADTRDVLVDLDNQTVHPSDWNSLRVLAADDQTFYGWWRIADLMVHTIVCDFKMEAPIRLSDSHIPRVFSSAYEPSPRMTDCPLITVPNVP